MKIEFKIGQDYVCCKFNLVVNNLIPYSSLLVSNKEFVTRCYDLSIFCMFYIITKILLMQGDDVLVLECKFIMKSFIRHWQI